MRPLPLSVTIITLNEESNLARALESVRGWAEDILVVDSGSTDKTLDIARTMGARVISNAWPGYGQQKNFAQAQALHDWVLNLDADEAVTPELKRQIDKALTELHAKQLKASAFCFPRRTYYLGQWIRHGGWYPNVITRLAQKSEAAWTEPNVHEDLQSRGPLVQLSAPLDHFAFTSIHDQILTNLKFSKLGSEDLRRRGQKPSLPLLLLKPIGKFIETYLLKRGFLDGLAGFIISINAAHSIFLKYAFLFEPVIRAATQKSERPNP